MTPGPGIEPRTHWREANALATAPSLLHTSHFTKWLGTVNCPICTVNSTICVMDSKPSETAVAYFPDFLPPFWVRNVHAKVQLYWSVACIIKYRVYWLTQTWSKIDMGNQMIDIFRYQPEILILGDDVKDRGLWRKECSESFKWWREFWKGPSQNVALSIWELKVLKSNLSNKDDFLSILVH